MDEESQDFSLLPYEVAQGFFNHLSHAQRKKCRMVCNRWCNNLDYYPYPRYFVFRPTLNNDSATGFFNSKQTMDKVTMKDMTNEFPSNNFPEIKNAVIEAKNSGENIIRFLTHGCGESTQSFTLTNLSLTELREDVFSQIWQDKTWTGLSELNICLIETEDDVKHLEAVIHFLTSAKVPNTRKFSIEFIIDTRGFDWSYSRSKTRTRGKNLCLASFNFIAGHAQSLRTLFFRLSNDSSETIDIPPIVNLLNGTGTAELQLESCSITLCGVTHAEHLVVPKLFGSHIQSLALQVFPQTKKYTVQTPWVTEANRNILNNNIGQIFANNQAVLRSVTFWGFPFVTLAWFANCSALEAVKVGPYYDRGSYFLPRHGVVPNDIFNAASCVSLRKIWMHDRRINFSWFRNCVNLEDLNISTFVGICTTQPEALVAQNSRMNLRKIKLIMAATQEQNCVPEIQRMLQRSGPSVKYFDVEICNEATYTLPDAQLVHLAFDLSQCTNIQHLHTSVTGNSLMRYNLDTKFENLTLLECCIDTVQLAEAIVENMKNLLSIGVILKDDYIPFVRILIQLPKVRQIEFREPEDPPRLLQNGIQEFFDHHPNMTLKKGKSNDRNNQNMRRKIRTSPRMIITVERSTY